jgi:hypothetical protein
VLAVIAIAISGVTFLWTVFWAIMQRRLATRPRLTVRCVWAIPASLGFGIGSPCIQTTATNTGLAPVTLDSSTLLIRGRRRDRVAVVDWVAERPQPLPARLEPGSHWMGLADAASVKATLDHHLGARESWSVRPIVGDSTGRAYKARPGAGGWRRLLRRRWMKL